MTRRCGRLLAAAWLASCVMAAEGPRGAASPGVKKTPPARITTLMYLVRRPDALASFREHARDISIVAPQVFTMDAEGFVGGEVPAEVLEVARRQHVAVMPLVTNLRFNQPLMHTVLDSATARQRAIRYLLYYALRDGYLGFQFDFENIHFTYQDRFSAFFREAAQAFHRQGLRLTLAVVGKYADDRNAVSPGGFDNWSGVYDYRALGADADFVSIMAYPQHGGFSGPGPLAGIPWVTKVVQYTTERMPAKKVSLGVPLYGFKWTELKAGEGQPPPAFVQDAPPPQPRSGVAGDPGAGPAVRRWRAQSQKFADVRLRLAGGAAPEWDEKERAPYLRVTEQDVAAELWWEDARSLGAKLELAAAQKLAGISGWVLGSEDPAFWEVVRQYRVQRPRSHLATGPVEKRAKAAARKLESSYKP